ncbi:MAG TPA: hypothetical protein VM925_11260 [Labilithrix sp.]|nr:hypothetical protein [Labilithrix sp.]
MAAPEASADVYVGAVGAFPVRAWLSVTPGRIEGRWVYEDRGSPEGLKLASASEAHGNVYELHETTVSGQPTGELSLGREGASLTGTWQKPGSDRSLRVVLTRELRSRSGDQLVRARRIMVKHLGPPASAVPDFLPMVEGPGADSVMRELTLKNVLGQDERELDDGTTGLDFDVVHHDERFLTISMFMLTMGAYPSGYGKAVTVARRTGARIGAEAFRLDRREELVRLLDARVRAAWQAKKRELMAGPTSDTTCGPDVVTGFMSGRAPSFSPAMLDTVFVTARGIAFQIDIELPHVVRACSPEVDLSLSWAEARPYLHPHGSLSS